MFNFFKQNAPEFPLGLTWLNTNKQLSLSLLKGHVIVLDFWTYCCINCMHLLPELKELEHYFKDEPVVFIGAHSAKFDGENNERAITSAMLRYEVEHPVVIDAEHKVWNSFGITGWPSICIIDEQGKIAYHESGEGQKEQLRKAISSMLSSAKKEGTLAKEKISISPTLAKEKSTLSFPGKINYDEELKELIISDSNNHRILITKLKGNTATVLQEIGSGIQGFTDGSFSKAQFNRPQGISREGNKIYVADTENHSIRLIDLEAKKVSTLAGDGLQAIGTPRLNRSKSLNSPWDVLVKENMLYVAMAGSHQIWCRDIKTCEFESFAGTSGEDIIDGPRTQAFLAQPSGLCADKNNLYFADSEVSAIRKISFETDQVMTIIGEGLFEFGKRDGDFKKTLLQHPLGLDIFDKKIYIADTYNSAIRVADLSEHNTTTLIESDPEKTVCKIGDKSCSYLPLNEPNDVIALKDKLIIADTNNHLIRLFDFDKKELEDIEVRFSES